MDSAELTRLIQELEDRVERLRALYEQYFMGIERIEPLTLRKEVDRRLWTLRREQIRNTGTRFKLQTVVQRYNTYQQYWQRIVREIETGTYQRDLGRAAQRFGEAATTSLGRRRQKMFEKGLARRMDREGVRQTRTSAPPTTTSMTPNATVEGSRDAPASVEPMDVYDDMAIDDSEMFDAEPESNVAPAPSSSPAPRLPPRPDGKGAPRPASVNPLARLTRASTGSAAFSQGAPSIPFPPVLPAGSGATSTPRAVDAAARPALPAARAPAVPVLGASATHTGNQTVPRAPSLPSLPARPSPAAPAPRALQARPAEAAPHAPPAPALAATGAGRMPPPVGGARPGPMPPPLGGTRPASTPAAVPPADPLPPALSRPPTPAVSRTGAVSRPGAEASIAARPNPAVAAPATQPEGGLSPVRLRQIYGAYVEAKRHANESTAALTYDKIAANLSETAKLLREKHQGREVDFEVILKNGKPVLKPVLKG